MYQQQVDLTDFSCDDVFKKIPPESLDGINKVKPLVLISAEAVASSIFNKSRWKQRNYLKSIVSIEMQKQVIIQLILKTCSFHSNRLAAFFLRNNDYFSALKFFKNEPPTTLPCPQLLLCAYLGPAYFKKYIYFDFHTQAMCKRCTLHIYKY